MLLKGQIVGGVAQGVGQILMEDIQFDGEGQIVSWREYWDALDIATQLGLTADEMKRLHGITD